MPERRRLSKKTVEVRYEFSTTVPFHKVSNVKCNGVDKEGILEPSSAVPLKTVIECLECHTHLIPTATPIYSA